MSRLWPTVAEASTLHFLVPVRDLRARVLVAGALFATGIAAWCLLPVPVGLLGLPLLLAGHLFLWVRRQTNAPGGATPKHEEVWAPVEDEWLERVVALERRGEAWDATPWDITSGRGCLTLLLALGLLLAAAAAAGARVGPEPALLLLVALPLLVVPLWLNGIRTTWNPSELRKKGEALAVACEVAAAATDFEPVPMLALREGRRGKYPVDARLMLRPASDDGAGFLGVQVQVALNNVQGTDYPYLYAVVLGKTPFDLPPAKGRHRRRGDVEFVFERGRDGEVDYLVIRQNADTSGGWHTEPGQIREIVTVALEEGRTAQKANAARERR